MFSIDRISVESLFLHLLAIMYEYALESSSGIEIMRPGTEAFPVVLMLFVIRPAASEKKLSRASLFVVMVVGIRCSFGGRGSKGENWNGFCEARYSLGEMVEGRVIRNVNEVVHGHFKPICYWIHCRCSVQLSIERYLHF